MAQFDKETLAIVKRLQMARLNLLRTQPFYALLLLHMTFSLDLSCDTAYTDGMRIAFNPDFIDKLSDSELEFVLIHEVLHVALQHCFRRQSDYDPEAYDIACDIVVNSNILSSFHMDLSAITLKAFGESMHLTPNGDEGYLYSVDEVYKIVLCEIEKQQLTDEGCSDSDMDSFADILEEESKDENLSSGERKLVKALAGLYRKLVRNGTIGASEKPPQDLSSPKKENTPPSRFDDHTFWEGENEDKTQGQTWLQRMVDATEIVANMRFGGNGCGTVPLGIERELKKFKEPQIDWRTILHNFVQDEINDYSFSPPDRRFDDSPFFLPDYNGKDDVVKDILFMIDTSGSMSDAEITAVYSEIKGAIDQFDGKLKGWLGFFDAETVEPIPFESEEEFMVIRPSGGGGTDFDVIFKYVSEKMRDQPPASIIILTDGIAPYPDESAANNIPVLWLLVNDYIDPPWGKVARIKVEDDDLH